MYLGSVVIGYGASGMSDAPLVFQVYIVYGFTILYCSSLLKFTVMHSPFSNILGYY